MRSAGGCVSLISGGNSAAESAFLDASASGNDVFFVTACPLVRRDKDTSYDVYDASVCGQPARPPASDARRPRPRLRRRSKRAGRHRLAGRIRPPATTERYGNGNLRPQQQSPAIETARRNRSPSRTEARRALKLCKKDKKKSKRVACEKQARKDIARLQKGGAQELCATPARAGKGEDDERGRLLSAACRGHRARERPAVRGRGRVRRSRGGGLALVGAGRPVGAHEPLRPAAKAASWSARPMSGTRQRQRRRQPVVDQRSRAGGLTISGRRVSRAGMNLTSRSPEHED